ncbi:MAG: pyridoxamine 5'-phosphate oxidase family protein [Thermoanaerobaculia bacterium]
MKDSKSELTKMYELIEDSGTPMFTTRRADGHLVSRPMAQQKPAPGADLWFVATAGSPKLAEIAGDAHVNVAYFRNRTKEWVSVSGLARESREISIIHQLFEADWSIWFPKGDDPRMGTADDPRIALIGVDVHSAVFLEQNKPQPVVLFELVKGWLTGEKPELGETHVVNA